MQTSVFKGHGVQMTYSKTISLILLLFIIFSSFLSAFSAIRLLEIFDTAVFNRINLLMLLPLLLVLVIRISRQKIRVDPLVILLFLMILIGATVGVMRRQPFNFIATDTGAILIAATAYFVALQRWAASGELAPVLSWGARIILVAQLAQIAAGYLILFAFKEAIYFSLSDILGVLCFVWFLVQRKTWGILLSAAIILASGKVGVILSMLTVVILAVCRARKISIVTVAAALSLFVLAINAVQFSQRDISIGRATEFGGLATKLLVFYNPHRVEFAHLSLAELEDSPAEDIGGGRVAEIIYSTAALRKLDAYPLVTGGGHGFNYDMWYRGEFRPNSRNVHFSPFSLATRYGVVITAIYYALIIFSLTIAYRNVRDLGPNRIALTAFYFCVASFVFSFTAYYVFVAIPFWIFLGLLNNKTFRDRAFARRRGAHQQQMLVAADNATQNV